MRFQTLENRLNFACEHGGFLQRQSQLVILCKYNFISHYSTFAAACYSSNMGGYFAFFNGLGGSDIQENKASIELNEGSMRNRFLLIGNHISVFTLSIV